MTTKDLADRIDGREYRETLTREEEQLAKENGLVIIHGASDDLAELHGAIDDEVSVGHRTTFTLTQNGILRNKCEYSECPYFHEEQSRIEKKGRNTVRAIWGAGNTSWTYETDIPHETFRIMEDGETYCVGIVVALADIAA